jgi:hypothetical protein
MPIRHWLVLLAILSSNVCADEPVALTIARQVFQS